MIESWFHWNSGVGSPALNMAWDAVLLEQASMVGRPLLRFYSWSEPASTFGYFQQIAIVERATQLRPLIRRPTGGGIVPHDADWTYSILIPASHAWYGMRAEASYERAHQWVAAAFESMGITVTLAPCCRKELPGQCFVGHEKSDVLWNGRKIAGAAQRRTRDGLLIQGSVQPPPGSENRSPRADWESAMLGCGKSRWGCDWSEFEPQAALKQLAALKAAETFSRSEYNNRR